jgi:hypothetical protein
MYTYLFIDMYDALCRLSWFYLGLDIQQYKALNISIVNQDLKYLHFCMNLHVPHTDLGYPDFEFPDLKYKDFEHFFHLYLLLG